MQLSVEDRGSHVLASTVGPLDDSAGDPFKEQLHPIVGQKDARLIVDISDSPRINSIGIACLVRLFTEANKSGSQVVLLKPAPFVENVFHVTRLKQFFVIAQETGEALNLLRGSAAD